MSKVIAASPSAPGTFDDLNLMEQRNGEINYLMAKLRNEQFELNCKAAEMLSDLGAYHTLKVDWKAVRRYIA